MLMLNNLVAEREEIAEKLGGEAGVRDARIASIMGDMRADRARLLGRLEGVEFVLRGYGG